MANLKLIKDIAEERGISIRRLSEQTGISLNQIHLMCRTNSTKIQTLESIAKALGVRVSVFFDESEDISPSVESQKESTELIELRAEISRLKNELLAAQGRIISLMDQLHTQCR